MRLDQALVQQKLCESRQEAQELIASGNVLVDEAVCTKQTRQVTKEALVVTSSRKYVSRGGIKLEGAFFDAYKETEVIHRELKAKFAIDIGSSTGGFTDCLLNYGAAHVTCVDVGSSQLHPKLQKDDRVSLFENTDIRNLKTETVYDLIVADVSFITLEKIIDVILSFGKSGSEYFLLIKPQFEVGKGNTKKGIVKDSKLVKEILEKYSLSFSNKGFKNIEVFPCKIQGGDGNQEYFIYTKQV